MHVLLPEPRGGAGRERGQDDAAGDRLGRVDWFLAQAPPARKKLSVWFMGGEPLAEFRLIQQIVAYGERRAERQGVRLAFGATTNLVLVNERVLTFWKAHDMTWNTSIDGAPATHDACRVFPDGSASSGVVSAAARRVLAEWPKVTARASVSPHTAPAMPENLEYLLDLGYRNVAMIPVVDEPWSEAQLAGLAAGLEKAADVFIERYRRGQPFYFKLFDKALRAIVKPERPRRPCGAGNGMVCVDAEGGVWPCHRFPTYDLAGRWRLGDIERGIDEDKRLAFSDIDARRDSLAECERCPAVLACGLGCPAANYFTGGRLLEPPAAYCECMRIVQREALRIYYVLTREANPAFAERYRPSWSSGSPRPDSARRPTAVRLPRLSCGAV